MDEQSESKEEKQKWLDSLKPGDQVAYLSGYGKGRWNIAKVKNRTDTGRIILHNDYAFNKDGRFRGTGSMGPFEIQRPNAYIKNLVYEHQIRSKLQRITWQEFTIEELQAIYNIVLQAEQRLEQIKP